MDHFFRALRERGYEEGRNIAIERRHAEGRDDRYAALAAELVAAPVDVLLAAGPSATRAARAATTSIPIVMGTVDAVEQGLITSLARPGGNVTGWTLLSVESAEKQLSLLKEAMPQLSRVAVVANPRMPGHRTVVESVGEGARKMGMRLTSVEVASPEALEPAFATLAKERIEGFFATPDPVVMDRVQAQVTSLAARAKLPGIYQWRSYAQAGGLMSYGPSLTDLIASWATTVDKILKGAKPADLPVETPRRYELVLNDRAAKELGFVFPAALRLAANEVLG
jgi:putative ABC transport system substrate-binding protein